MTGRMFSNCEYDVALSFAGEDRDYVERVAMALRARNVRVFYDGFEEATLWGKDLYVHLREVYQYKARFTVLFASAHYARKAWPSHERASAQARALSEAAEYILPARFDETEIPGLLSTTGYIDLRRKSPDEVADLVYQKLAQVSGLGEALSGAGREDPSSQAPTPPRRSPFRTRQPGDKLDRIMVPFRSPTGINIPASYRRTLNARAAEIAAESAVREENGFRYPVHLRGKEGNLHSFTNEAVNSYGARSIASAISNGAGELWFEYSGSTPPAVMQDIARRHHLEIVQCGATLLSYGS